MNAITTIKPTRVSAVVAHSIMAYDSRSDELLDELPIPAFLDSLALKVAEVPREDRFGAGSYRLAPNAVELFRFLLGLHVDLQSREYFLEGAIQGAAIAFPPRKRRAVALLSEVSPPLRYPSMRSHRISEGELVLPTLSILEHRPQSWAPTSFLIAELTKLFRPSGDDAKVLDGRSDTYFSQKVRNMISHRDQPSSFIHRGLANYAAEHNGLKITPLGRDAVQRLRS